MKRLKQLISLSLLVLLAGGQALQAQTAVRAGTLYTMDGDPIEDGVVLIRDGLIEEVGPASSVNIPSGWTVHEAEVVTPGLIDAHTVVGLAGIFNVDADQDQLETSSPLQPELRALDAYNAREDLVKYVLDMGVTTVHTGHGPGALASGQTMIAKTPYNTVEEAVVDSITMVAFTLGSDISGAFSSPGTRAKAMSMLRQQFIKAQEYLEQRNSEDPPSRDLTMEVLADILEGKVTAMITAQRAHDIMTALRLQEEFGFPMVLDGAAEAYLVMDHIRDADVPVFVHPTKVRTGGSTRNASFETAGKLAEAGITFAFQSGYEGYVPKTRIVLFEAAIAAANGLSREAALRALTIDAAEILGIADRVGSLAPGKDADLVLYDGDPFEYTTHVTRVLVDGAVVSDGRTPRISH
ncbi:MAG: amidohydrolase family protein [Balneolaceae bacterium]|nr:amidohydrolase family protein [Balneolaceae bacterium]